jgi:hypothetical protein
MDGGVGVTVSGVPHGGVVVERSGACLSIRAAGAPAGRRSETMLPAEPGRTAVVVDDRAAPALHALDRGLLGDLDRHLWTAGGGARQGLRLLVGGAARPGADGAAPLAARLAEALGIEVVAPDGPVVVLRRGELFCAGAAGGWWGFTRGRRPEPAGSRFPPPAWQRDLPADIGSRMVSGLVTVTPVPTGLWVRGAGGPAAELSDPGYAVPPAAMLAVLVGRPGEAWPAVAGLAEVIGALPPALRQRYVLVPYGPEPAGQPPLAQQLADWLGADVRATHGLPCYAADGSLDFALLDDSGRRSWRPLVTESVYHPGAQPPTRSSWSPPLADLPPAGPASFWLAEGWVVDVLASGLLVRPATSAPDSAVLRRPADPRHLDIVVTAAVRAPGNVPVPVLGAIGWLARALPPAAQDRLRILITDQVDPPELLGLAGALRLPIHRLTHDGITPAGDDARAVPADPFPAQPPAQLHDPTPQTPPAQHPRRAATGHPPARPDSVGRLHASVVPTTAGPAAAPAPPAAAADPGSAPDPSTADDRAGRPAATVRPGSTADGTSAGLPPAPTEPDLSTADDRAGRPAATVRPGSTADGTSAGLPPAPTGSGGAAPAETPASAGRGGGRPVTIRADGRIRPVRGQSPGSRNDAAAAPAGSTLPAAHPTGPGRPPQPSPPTAPSPAPAGAAPPTSPSHAEQPLPTPAPHSGPPPLVDQPRDGDPATVTAVAPMPVAPMPVAPMPGAAMPVAAPARAAGPVGAGLVLVTPDRAGGVERWWRQAATALERQQFRLSLGWRFDAASRYVTRLLSQRPGLRAAAAGDEGVATDLAAVHVFAASDHAELVESLRAGSVRVMDRTFVSCVVSGLRRLPTLTGLVVRGGPEDPAAAQVYVPGCEVEEMGLLVAVADPVAEVPGGVEVLIWSSTARRLDGLVEGAEATQVVFLPGTVFRVLEVDRTGERCRVLLAEVPQNWRGQTDPDRDERIRGRLCAAAQARAADPAGADGGGDDADHDGDGERAGQAGQKARQRWTGGGLVALPGLLPAESLRGAA